MRPFSKKLLLIPIVILSLGSVIFIVYKIYSTQKTTAPSQNISPAVAPAKLEKITPGQTTKAEVINMLGQPLKDTLEGTSETLFYSGTSKTLSHQIIIEGGIVVMVKEMILYGDPEKVSDITKVYGLSTYSLYSAGSEGGSKLYIYPDKGIAYIGMPQFDTLEEIWHFIPMSIEDFRKKWASNYFDKPVLNLY